jgi:hypothetical protein
MTPTVPLSPVRSQIWIAVSIYVLVAIVRKQLGLELGETALSIGGATGASSAGRRMANTVGAPFDCSIPGGCQ